MERKKIQYNATYCTTIRDLASDPVAFQFIYSFVEIKKEYSYRLYPKIEQNGTLTFITSSGEEYMDVNTTVFPEHYVKKGLTYTHSGQYVWFEYTNPDTNDKLTLHCSLQGSPDNFFIAYQLNGRFIPIEVMLLLINLGVDDRITIFDMLLDHISEENSLQTDILYVN